MFSIGTGFNIRGDLLGIGGGGLASRWLYGRCTCIGKWSELRSRLIFVAKVYSLLLGVLI